MKKNQKITIICFVLSFILLFFILLLINSKQDVASKDENVGSGQKEIENHDYDGVYQYNIKSKEDNVVSSGYFIINGKQCNSRLGVITNDDSSKEQDIDGECSYNNSKIKINTEFGTYTCTIENKNLKCNTDSYYGFTRKQEEEANFIYKYSIEEFEEFYKTYSLNLPENLRWEMSAAEAKNILKTDYISTYSNFNTKFSSTELINTNLDESYGIKLDKAECWFWDDKLMSYNVTFEKKPLKPYDSYKKIKEFLMKKYGNPASEDYQWNSDNYKDDETKWNEAMKYDYLDISTVWDLDDFHIYLEWDYNEKNSIDYLKNGYEEYR